MILTIAATLLVGLLAMAPGFVLVHGRVNVPGQYAAASCVSLTVVLLATALLGMAWGALTGSSIPAWSVVLIASAALVTCIALRHGKLRPPLKIEWEGCVLALVMIAFGLIIHALAVQNTDDGALLIHAWYNADWFKHMGHVASLRNSGIPARDIFNAMEPLHYYWLSYLLPAAGSSLGGHNSAALITAQAIIVGLLCTTLYGTLRATLITRAIALVGAILAFLLCVPLDVWFAILSIGFEGYVNAPLQPNFPSLLATALYIPQHTLVLTLFLSWFLLDRPSHYAPRLLRLFALLSLASALTVSTLLGACVLAAYGLLQLWRRGVSSVVEVAFMAFLSAALTFALGVISLDNPASAIDSPLLTDASGSASLATLMLQQVLKAISEGGLPLALALVILVLSRNDRRTLVETDGRRLAIVLLAIALTAPALAEALLSPRLAFELSIRAAYLSAIAVAIVLTSVFDKAWRNGQKQRSRALCVLVVLIVIAAPSFVALTVWHGNTSDNFTTEVPGDDRKVLALISQRAAPNDLVWQYPEPPFLARPSGRDAWVATIAGRAVTGSLRATDYKLTEPRIAAARTFYGGKSDMEIDEDVSWIYLSRTLHPLTFERLVVRMQSQQGWSQIMCYPDACLFKRERSDSP